MAALTPSMIAALTKIVQKQVSRAEEIKTAQTASTNLMGSYNYTAFGSNQIQVLSPYSSRNAIGQGTGQGDRVGNVIMIKRAIIRFLFTMNPYNVVSNPSPQPVWLLWYVFKRKCNAVEQSSLSAFFQAGDSSQAPSGSATDLLYPVNSDLYTVFKQGREKVGYASYAGTGALPLSGNFSNNDGELLVRLDIDFTQGMKKRQDFNDTTNTALAGPGVLEIAFWTVNSDGSVPATSTAPVTYTYVSEIDFTDA